MIAREKVLQLKIRQEIYDHILNNPGMHLREISRKMKIPKTTLSYHITFLIKNGLIKENYEGEYKRFFVKDKLSSKDKKLLYLLRQEVPRRIFLYLITTFAFSQIEISKDLNVHPATIKYHLDKMVEIGVIEKTKSNNGLINLNVKNFLMKREPVGREFFYRRKNNEIIKSTYRLLISYKDSIPDSKIIESYISYLKEVEKFDLKSKGNITKNFQDSMNQILDTVEDLFKPPFVF